MGHAVYLHANKIGGVRNGVDYDVWNPEIDSNIPHRYGMESLERKWRG